jgi:glycosyltransferase involved in cell wall biosynthesis
LADKRKKHVLHLIGSTGLYGAERWILALMRAMNTDRFRSTLINLVDSSEECSAVVHAAKQRGLEASDFVTGGKFNLFAAVRLAKWVKEQQVDIIHGHGYKSDLLGLLTAKRVGCRMMTTPHGWSVEKDKKLQVYEKLDRFSFRFMDMVCPLSETLYLDAIKYNKNRVRLIANGVDLEEIRSFAAPDVSKNGAYVIGYIGRLVKSKDIDTLLRAIALLASSGREIKLILVGDGEYSNELIAISEFLGITNIVHFFGFRSDTAALLEGFDCFVLPSLSEGTPRCIMEAMALKVPVVASDIPGNRLLVTHNETGLLFPVGACQNLADAISFIMDNPDEAKNMAESGCLKVEENYSNRIMAREYGVIYESLK